MALLPRIQWQWQRQWQRPNECAMVNIMHLNKLIYNSMGEVRNCHVPLEGIRKCEFVALCTAACQWERVCSATTPGFRNRCISNTSAYLPDIVFQWAWIAEVLHDRCLMTIETVRWLHIHFYAKTLRKFRWILCDLKFRDERADFMQILTMPICWLCFNQLCLRWFNEFAALIREFR